MVCSLLIYQGDINILNNIPRCHMKMGGDLTNGKLIDQGNYLIITWFKF